MALVIPTGFAQASIQMRATGDPDPWYITHGVDVSDAGGDYTAVAGLIASAWTLNVLAQLPTSASMTGVQLQVGQDGADPLTLFFPFDEPGGSASAKLPQNCALLVTKQTARSGKTGKGRVFIPLVLNEGDVSNVGVIDGTVRNNLQGDIDGVLEYLSSGGASTGPSIPMVLLHNPGAPGGTVPTLVNALVVDPVISTQRRRLR